MAILVVEWKSATISTGELCVMIAGITSMLELFANNLDIQKEEQ